MSREHSAYRASLCEAHIPVINELIQRYRLQTYDYFPYEVRPGRSVWYVTSFRTPAPYTPHSIQRLGLQTSRRWTRGMDSDGTPTLAPFEWADKTSVEAISSESASQGEFDLKRMSRSTDL